MLNVCLTFDYELFFGENYYSPDDVLFQPTDCLIKLLEKSGVSATFFVDICSYIRSKELGQEDYASNFEKQIRDMLLHGQDVQLHIHPHWYDSTIDEGKWHFSNKRYRLQQFEKKDEEGLNCNYIISDCLLNLEKIAKTVDPSYQCIAFRAGGFCFQPHSEIAKALISRGIKVDSSIPLMTSCSSTTNNYDYKKKLPYVNWHISPEEDWWEDSNQESLYEIPIGTETKNIPLFLFRRAFAPNTIKIKKNIKGSFMKSDQLLSQSLSSKILDYLLGYNLLSLDSYRAGFLFSQLKRFKRKHDCSKKDSSIAIIGHPKLIDALYLENLKRFIGFVNDDRNIKLESIVDAYKGDN